MKDPRLLENDRFRQAGPPPEQLQRAQNSARELALGPISLEAAQHAYQGAIVHWGEFTAYFSKILSDHEKQRADWIAFLSREIAEKPWDQVNTGPQQMVADWFHATLEAWSEETDPFEVWGPRHANHGGQYIDDYRFFLLGLLRALDLPAFSRTLDRLPSPVLMETALYLYGDDVQGDREQIETLLRLAPPAFDAEGRWLPSRPVLILLIVDRIVAEELPAWMRKAFGILLERPDGRPIALALLGRYAASVLHAQGRSDGGNAWSAEESAFMALVDVLRAASLRVSDVREAWKADMLRAEHKERAEKGRRKVLGVNRLRPAKDEGEGARTLKNGGLPFLYGAVHILGNDASKLDPSEILLLQAWLDELLLGRDPFLPAPGYYEDGLNDLATGLGLLLAQQAKPGESLRAAYVRLEPQRRREMFYGHHLDIHCNLPSLLMLRIGFCTAHAWRIRDPKGAQELFFWLYEASVRLWLTLRRNIGSMWVAQREQLISSRFAFMPSIFGHDLGDALKRTLRPIANDPELIIEAAALLSLNSTPPEQLPYLFHQAGIDLQQAIRDQYEWHTLINKAFPPEYKELADALNIKLKGQTPEAPPPHSERSLLLPILTQSLPFAPALLQRLQQDSFTITRINCLSQWNTWLLQAQLPPTLAEQFGLSPEIRILAVNGQIQGSDIRRALQDPEHAELVDPDLIVAVSEHPDLERRLPMLAAPFGQRIRWQPKEGQFQAFEQIFQEQAPNYDLFDYRDPVQGSAYVGRGALIQDLARRLVQAEAIGVVGLRKVGKSSLFRAVAQQIDPVGAHLGMFESLNVPLPQNTKPEALLISLDVQGISSRWLDDLLAVLCEELLQRLDLAKLPIPDGLRAQISDASFIDRPPHLDPMNLFRELLRIPLEQSQLPLCFIFDEYDLLFEGYDNEAEIPGIERLLAYLRAESNATHRISLAFIGRDPVFLDRPHLAGRTNPLAGWAKPVFLVGLGRAESDLLLTRIGKRMGFMIGPETLNDAWERTGGHPMLLRQYGAALFELMKADGDYLWGAPTDPLVPDAGKKFYQRYMVEMICSEVQALLRARYSALKAEQLLEALCMAWPDDVKSVLAEWGGTGSQAFEVLRRFGLVYVQASGIWIPQVYRDWFAPAFKRKHRNQRSAAGECPEEQNE